jgi:integrase
MEINCKTVNLYKRKNKAGDRYSYYLDYYPGYRDRETMQLRRRETLGIYTYVKPKNQRERDYNERMEEKAEALRCRRYESIVNERYDFVDKEKLKGDFLAYFKRLADKKNEKWVNVCRHFAIFCQGKCTFGEIDVDLCRKFMEYLQEAHQIKHTHLKLHPNSIAGYWSTFRACLHTAYRDHKILENPNGFLDRLDTIPTKREHLSLPELRTLYKTECEIPVLKRAFLFACLTGLRKSDIINLEWENIQQYDDGVMYITTRMQKTKEFVNNPISREAYELLGEPGEGRIFKGFNSSMTQGPLQKWIKAAGITKHISFHCSRHSFGCLQLNSGTPLHVVQHMLGHKNVSTTEIYAKMNDQQKMQTVNRITLKETNEAAEE